MKEQQETVWMYSVWLSVWYVRYVYVYGHDQYRTVPDSVAAVTNSNCWYYMTASYPN